MGGTRWAPKELVLGLNVALCLALPASASGAVTLGKTFDPPIGNCDGQTYIQSSSEGDQYEAPSDGVITSWSFKAQTPAPLLRFKVVRPVGIDIFSLVGESALTGTIANQLNSFPVRIPAQSGDVIGIYRQGGGACFELTGPDDGVHWLTGDAPSGASLYPDSGTGARIPVAAQLEPDGDGDGFGDETQDQCPTDASTQGQCSIVDSSVEGSASAKGKQKQGGKKIAVKAKVTAGEDLSATGSGKVKVGKKSYKLKPKTKSVSSGKSKNLKLAPKKSKDTKKIVKALKKGNRAKASVEVELSDQAGNEESQKLSVELKR